VYDIAFSRAGGGRDMFASVGQSVSVSFLFMLDTVIVHTMFLSYDTYELCSFSALTSLVVKRLAATVCQRFLLGDLKQFHKNLPVAQTTKVLMSMVVMVVLEP